MSKGISLFGKESSTGFKVLFLDNNKDKITYTKCLNKIENTSPFHSLTFIKIFSEGLEDLICFKWQQGNQLILLAGYYKLIKEDVLATDFYSPYGYSGPVYSKGVEHQALEIFWIEVNNWLKEHQVVTSFIRFSLNDNTQGYQGVLKNTLLNIKGLIRKEEEQWSNFEPKVRKNVNKAKREGLISQVVKGNEIDKKQLYSFHKIYTTTLLRNSALKAYYSSLSDFEQYCKLEGDSCVFGFVYDADEMIAAEMVLLSNQSLYSFLGGTTQSSFKKRPNDLLKYALINWALNNGYSFFVLGGGLGKEDGIFKYKKSFFPNDIVPFYTGRQIFNKQLYSQLKEHAFANMPDQQKKKLKEINFFPEYRAKY